MKRFVLATLAATSLLVGGAAANAAPMRPIFGGHGPVVVHGGPIYRGPIGGRFGGPGFYPVGFRHFGYGAFLPAAFLAPERFVLDYTAYELAAPPANYEWVQNGPDALLVNLSTGMVVQVVPNAFA